MTGRRSYIEAENIKEVIDAIQLPDGWIDQFAKHPSIIDILVYLAHEAGVTDRQFIESRRKVPYFSKARWEEVAPKLGLQTNLDAPGLELARYSPPACYLPASFHEELFQAGWRMMDVYKERVDQDREAAKV